MMRPVRVKTRSLLRRKSAAAAMISAIFILFVYYFGAIITDSPDTWYKDVNTEYGIIRGWISENADYFSFLGIPYAAPPVGENRFQAPKPPPSREGILNATRTVKCPQKGEGDEDCLILNVFTPTKPSKRLPVLMYVHGGSFLLGSGQTAGVEHLINQEIIVVTINYRLGVLGFLCLGTKDAPGNTGLKDQIAALRWIENNIGNFGGDPDKVTVYGMSAGGASVEYLILSKANEEMFKSAIIESGSANSVWAVDADPIATAVQFARHLNIAIDESLSDLARLYRMIPARTLSEINYDFYNNLTDGTFGFVPCVERFVEGEESFIDKPPYEILMKQEFRKVPTMFLFTSTEGLYLRSEEYYKQNYKQRMEHNFLEFLPADLIFDSDNIKKRTATQVKQFYFGTKPVGNDTLYEYLNYFGDSLVLRSLFNSIEAHNKGRNPVYLMEFTYKGNMGSYEEFYESINTAGHGDVVKHVILNRPIKTEMDRITVKRLSTLIANFVKYGEPTPEETALIPIKWHRIHSIQDLNILVMDTDFTMYYDRPYLNRIIFWDSLYEKHRRGIKAVQPKSLIQYL